MLECGHVEVEDSYAILLLLVVAVGCSSSDQAAIDKAVSPTLATQPATSPTSSPARVPSPIMVAEQVNIDELVELATGNIFAADEYKGKLVTVDGIVVSVDENTILVAGLIAGKEAIEWGLIEMILDGFTCDYAKSEQSKAIQLRAGNKITVTGKKSLGGRLYSELMPSYRTANLSIHQQYSAETSLLKSLECW